MKSKFDDRRLFNKESVVKTRWEVYRHELLTIDYRKMSSAVSFFYKKVKQGCWLQFLIILYVYFQDSNTEILLL